ncbi:efflux RND transporter periplasmic adaptor subunit [uncultured Methylovirgula sp.]|uniref:efflux RND transporter periplasmic adaptor subunit n=1 Tax=uncultured Methylovirgula sp. TaxID=1285960 RepID=UPI00263368AC|nr:efflux RND transporter periplasmic adaptor subunit [uncultured Methylovirgula sp.]
MRTAFIFLAMSLALPAVPARAAQTFTVEPATIADEKAVFATVESREVVPARVRTGGTIASLSVREGDWVQAGQIVATIGDEKLTLQKSALDAQIAGLKAQLEQAQTDLARAAALVARGIVSKAQFDAATTAADVAANALKARIAERSVLEQQLTEGQVLAPTAGRVLKVPVTADTVVMSGETIADIARADFVLRLRVPERHARFLKAGDEVRIDGRDIGKQGVTFGKIALVYPQIENGRVVADAQVAGLGDYFLGERIEVWISGGERRAFIVPAHFIVTRFGLDYARLRQANGTTIEVPIQRGREQPRPDMPDALEILSGLQAGDVLVQP